MSLCHRRTDPHGMLAAVRNLTLRVRLAQRGTWFPLLVFAVITLAVIPIYRYAPHHLGPCRSSAQGTSVCTSYIPLVRIYWPIALVPAYTAIAAHYVRRSRRHGVGSRIRPYVIVGVVLAVLLAAASVWQVYHPLVPRSGSDFRVPPVSHGFLFGLASPRPGDRAGAAGPRVGGTQLGAARVQRRVPGDRARTGRPGHPFVVAMVPSCRPCSFRRDCS